MLIILLLDWLWRYIYQNTCIKCWYNKRWVVIALNAVASGSILGRIGIYKNEFSPETSFCSKYNWINYKSLRSAYDVKVYIQLITNSSVGWGNILDDLTYIISWKFELNFLGPTLKFNKSEAQITRHMASGTRKFNFVFTRSGGQINTQMQFLKLTHYFYARRVIIMQQMMDDFGYDEFGVIPGQIEPISLLLYHKLRRISFIMA